MGKARVQPAYKIDTSLVNPLAFLPEFSVVNGQPPLTLKNIQAAPKVPPQLANLAERNLQRGVALGLPSGQEVARVLGEEPLPDSEIRIGKATFEDAFGDKGNPTLASIARRVRRQGAALVLRAGRGAGGLDAAGARVGQEGRRGRPDPHPARTGRRPDRGRDAHRAPVGRAKSFLRQDPAFKPSMPAAGATFTMGDLIKYALKL